MSPLAKAIYKTLAFFDAQDLPLTLLEIKNYLVAEPGLPETIPLSEISGVCALKLRSAVVLTNGFYHLAGRRELVAQRLTRYKICLTRFRKARLILPGLRFVPYLRAVAISGSQALLNGSAESDIDLFLIAKKNRIWLLRFFVSSFFQILGQRRHGSHIKNRFCLNHYLNESGAIGQDQNLYTAVEYASLLPVLGQEELTRFWAANAWLKNYLHEPVYSQSSAFFGFRFSVWQKVVEVFLDYTVGPALNWLAGLYQKQRIKLQDYIIVSDEELSFHPGSHGQKVLAAFQKNLQRLPSL